MLLLHILADASIALAYFFIATTLWRLVCKRGDLPFRPAFWMFSLFILSCGFTHVLAVWVIWHPDYLFEGVVKAVTAVSSLATAAFIVPLLPRALALRSPRELELINAELSNALNDLRAIVANYARAGDGAREVGRSSLSTLGQRLDDLMKAIRSGVRAPSGDQSDDLITLVVEASPSAMLLVDENGYIELVNAQAEKMFGYPRADVLDRPIEMLIPGGIFDARLAGADADVYGRRKDGSEVPLEIGLHPIETAAGTFTLAAVTDLTERRAAEELRRAQAQAELRAAELEAERERTWSTAFQRAVLPLALPDVAGCTFDALYEPGLSSAQVGGDWYDAVHLADGRVLISIGDVCGSGLDAAVVVGVTRQVMRGIAQLHANPSLILDAADRALCLEYPGVYVSAWVGLIDLVTRTVTYASAGHPPPLLIGADASVRELSDPMTMLIGLRDGLRGQPSTVALRQADTLVLFTDGVIEAGHDIIAGLAAIRAAATPGLRSAADLRRHVIPQGSSDDAAILVVRTDYAEAERHITRWNFDLFDQAEATAVRHHFVHSLSRVGFSADECSSAELVFGELIGNVVRHAPNSRRADVVVDHSGPQSVLHVLDRGAGFYHIGRLPRDPYAEHGRGLFLIGALSSDFTVSERPDGGSHARVVLRGGSAPRLTRPASARSAMPTHS